MKGFERIVAIIGFCCTAFVVWSWYEGRPFEMSLGGLGLLVFTLLVPAAVMLASLFGEATDACD